MSTLATLNVVLNGDIGGFLKAMKQAEGQSQTSSGLIGRALGTIGDVAKVAGAAAVAGIGMAVGAAVAGVAAFNSWADTLDSLGDVLGTSADESAGLAVAIRTVGGDVDGITGQMAKLVKGLGDAGGKMSPTAKQLKDLGVSAWGANGELKSSTDILTAVADKLAAMPDGLEKTAAMTTLFGKSGKDLSDTMNALANGGLKNATDKARKLGLAIGEDGVNKSIEFGKGMETIKLALEGAAVSIGSVLMPVIVPLISKFAEWAVGVMPQVRTGIEGVFNWIQTNVGPIISGLIAGLQTAVAWVTTNWPRISTEITGAFERARAVIGPVLSAIGGVIQSVFGAIATFLQTHGEEIKTFLTNAWESIKEIVTGIAVIISAVVTVVFGAIKDFLEQNGAAIQTVLGVVWEAIKFIVETTLNIIKGIVNTATAVLQGDWSTVWNTIKGIVEGIWNAIKSAWNLFWGEIQRALNLLGAALTSAWNTFWGGIKTGAENVWNGIKAAWNNFWDGIKTAVDTLSKNVSAAWDGFWNGLFDKVKEIIQPILDAINSIRTAWEDMLEALGISPPVEGGGGGGGRGYNTSSSVSYGAALTPAYALAGRGSEGGAITVNVNVDRIESDVDVERLAMRVVRAIRERQ